MRGVQTTEGTVAASAIREDLRLAYRAGPAAGFPVGTTSTGWGE
jgi:hypothetical protein